jgi:hypothetical protein
MAHRLKHVPVLSHKLHLQRARLRHEPKPSLSVCLCVVKALGGANRIKRMGKKMRSKDLRSRRKRHAFHRYAIFVFKGSSFGAFSFGLFSSTVVFLVHVGDAYV